MTWADLIAFALTVAGLGLGLSVWAYALHRNERRWIEAWERSARATKHDDTTA